MQYLLPIFTDAICEDDMEHVRQTLFAAGISRSRITQLIRMSISVSVTWKAGPW